MRAILGMLTHNRLIGVAAGALVTMIIQSSSATTVMLVSFVQAQLLTLPQSLGVILGADMPRMVANAHTLFNVGFALAFLPFLSQFNAVVMRLLPDLPQDAGRKYRARHLDPSQLDTPATAIALALSEIRRVGQTLQDMLQMAIEPFLNKQVASDPDFPELTLEQGIAVRGEKVNYLVQETENYVLQLTRQTLSARQADEATALLSIASDTRRIADLISRNIMPLMVRKRGLEVDFSNEGKSDIKAYHTKMAKQLSRLNELLSGARVGAAERILQKDSKYEKLEADLRNRHLARCQEQLKGSLVTHELHMELMDLLKHIGFYAANIARAVLRARTGEQET